jgi:integrase
VSKKRHYLVETVPAGPSAARDAERVRTRLLNQVDERRNPRTKATVNQLLDRWLEVVELEKTTRNSVVGRLNRHVRPVLGAVSVSRLDAETLESFYAQLRRCRERCGGGRASRAYLPAARACDDPADPREPQRGAEQRCPLALAPLTSSARQAGNIVPGQSRLLR